MEEFAKENGHCGSIVDLPRLAARGVLETSEQQTAGPIQRGVVLTSAGHCEAVHGELFRVLPRGEPTIETVAQSLALTPRMLSRRLAEEGTTFRQALADLRRRLAIQYVEGTGLGVDQIAMLLGYGHTASFRHAFRRWTGASVSVTRREALSMTMA